MYGSLKGHLVERMERVRGEREANVNYRHVIGSLVRKPGAFARYRFREQMFRRSLPLRQWRGATTMESSPAADLVQQARSGARPGCP